MLPRKLTHDQPEAERRRWRVVRLDTHEAIAGLILDADCESGAATMNVRRGNHIAENGKRTPIFEAEFLNFGPHGIAIIGR
jgi:hypothetical protein